MEKIYNKFIKFCKKQGCLFLVAWIALFASIIHIAIHLFKVWSFSVVDYSTFISACIGIVSLLIVFVVGWQILNAVEINNKVETVWSRSNEIDQQLASANRMNFSIQAFSAASMYRLDGKFNATHDNIGDAIVQYINAINAYEQASMLNCIPHTKEVIIEIFDLIPNIRICDCEKIKICVDKYVPHKSIFNATVISLLNAIKFRINHITEPLSDVEQFEIARIKKEASVLASYKSAN